MKTPILIALAALSALSSAQTWSRTTTNGPTQAGVELLLTDGSVMVHEIMSPRWWRLRPNAFGDYRSGTWTRLPDMQANYAPLYFASAVLADGRVVVMGGEYNNGSAVWTNLGAIFDPVANAWTPLAAPSGWSQIGDAQCTVLPDKRFAIANPFDTRMAILDPVTLTWTASSGHGKTDRFDEEGWTLLPDGNILTVDAINAPHTEKYIVSTGNWISAGNTPQSLTHSSSQEIGPAVLRPNGTVIAMGATSHNAVYTPGPNSTDPGTWTAAPDFPGGLAIADGPACLLPSGNVLCGASPGVFNAPTSFFEYDGVNFLSRPATPNSPANPCYVGNMLMLPTGQVMYTDFSADVEIYTPAGSPNPAWKPTLTVAPTLLKAGQTFPIYGTQFNGLSECSAYGDDSSNATNYPLVRVKNIATGHIFFCRTANHSNMGVATGSATVGTKATLPFNVESGPSLIQVVVNGIQSDWRKVIIYSRAAF